MKSNFSFASLLLLSAGLLALQSCQKSDVLEKSNGKTEASVLTGLPTKNSSGGGGTGGGGTSGGGHNGGSSSGGGIVSSSDPSLAPADTTPSTLPIETLITTGRWKVTSFVQNNDNLTSQFATYAFTYNSDNTVVADDNGNQTVGYWHNQEAVFYYGLPVYGSSSLGFTMNFGSGLPLMNLNENFFISKKTSTTISIDSVNPAENAHVTFSRLAQ